MTDAIIFLRHRSAAEEHPCGACGASFIPAEDSGSRVLGLKAGAQEFQFLLCGGCHSKWTHGATMKARSMSA